MTFSLRLIALVVLVGGFSGAERAPGITGWNVVAPAAGETVAGSVRVDVSTPPAATMRVEYWVDGVPVAEDRSCCTWSERFDSRKLADGPHSIVARAFRSRIGGMESGQTPAVSFVTRNTGGAQQASPPSGTDPPAATERSFGQFIVKCSFSHRKQVDPIVNPGPPGTLSHHLHDFFGNRSTDSSSTYASMTSAGTTCALPGDTAGYWAPTLLAPDGSTVPPVTAFGYYKNKPVGYGTTVPFPRDLRMIAGGVNAYPGGVFWDCFKGDGQYDHPPACGDDFPVVRVLFPNCWDGVHTDSPDHRSHVLYPVRGACPPSHPVKVPALVLFIRYPKGTGGPGYRLADGTTLSHADYWNTWDQSALTDLVRRCLNAGVDCGKVTG